MARVEVDEEDVRSAAKLRGVVNTMWSNPKARLLIQQAQKLVDPNAKTPDLDAEELAAAPVRTLEQKFDKFVEETRTEKQEREKNVKLQSLQKLEADGIAELRRQKYTDDGIKAVKALMEEKGILDPLDAAAIFEKQNPPLSPATPGGVGAWNFAELPTEGAEDFKKLIETKGNNDLIVERMAREAIAETRGQNLRR